MQKYEIKRRVQGFYGVEGRDKVRQQGGVVFKDRSHSIMAVGDQFQNPMMTYAAGNLSIRQRVMRETAAPVVIDLALLLGQRQGVCGNKNFMG